MQEKHNPRLYLAPMQGYTDTVFRNTYARFFDGLDIAVTPFISTIRSKKIREKHVKSVLPELNQTMPLIPQLMSNAAEDFITMANRLYDLGYQEINWNLGCPYRQVANKYRGSGLLPHPEKIDAFLHQVIPAISNRVSVKVRIGRHDRGEIFKLIPLFNQYPISEIMIHPRLGIQMYEGEVDLDTFKECLAQSAHPVVYNGDIKTSADYHHLSARFPDVHGWMIGRGLIIDPFLPAMIKAGKDGPNIPDEKKLEIFRQFHDALFAVYREILYGPSHITDRMKGFWVYFSQRFSDGPGVFKKIKKTRRPEEYQQITDTFFNSGPQWTNGSGHPPDCETTGRFLDIC